jgi:hypothetical protein
MREACAHTKACLARLSERLRRAFARQQDLGQGDLRRRCLGAAESVLAVRPDAVHRDVLVPERSLDEPAQERLGEILVTGGLGLLQMGLRNLPDIVEPTAPLRSACAFLALRPGDWPTARQPVQASFLALQAGQP